MSNIKIFTTQDNEVCLEVSLEEETVWLSQAQMVMLFGRNQSTIARHISNVFTEGELEEKSNMQKMHIANSDKPVRFFNLDVIISVGYRVKSERGVQFRKWATSVLKQYLIEGYALNQKRLQERNIEFEQAFSLLSSTLSNQSLVSQQGESVLSVVHGYARSWSLFQGYDEQKLEDKTSSQTNMFAIQLPDALKAIEV